MGRHEKAADTLDRRSSALPVTVPGLSVSHDAQTEKVPYVWVSGRLKSASLESVRTISLPHKRSAHSAKISCSVLNVDDSALAGTAPNFFVSRILSTARI